MGPAGVRTPVGGEKPGKGRHDISAAVVLHGKCQLFDFRGLIDQIQVVAKPLYQGAGNGDGALQAVNGFFSADLIAQGRQQAVAGRHRFVAGVQQQETSGAIGVFGLPDGEAGLTHQGRLLISQGAANRYRGLQGAVMKGMPPGFPVHGRHDARQHLRRNAEESSGYRRPMPAF